jgi:tetratricopeptide (TPR) repeat protein
MFISLLLALAITPAAQDVSPQKLFESGKYQAVVDAVRKREDAPPDQIYLRALAHRKLNQNDEAKEVFETLGRRDGVWKEIGNSGAAMIGGNMDDAAEAAKKAVEADGDSAQARFQLGLVESARNNQQQAAEAFARAAELDSQMAYAHYEAGMAFYKAKKVDRMAVYFENFLRLAPNAPERPAVQSIMKTIRGR